MLYIFYLSSLFAFCVKIELYIIVFFLFYQFASSFAPFFSIYSAFYFVGICLSVVYVTKICYAI